MRARRAQVLHRNYDYRVLKRPLYYVLSLTIMSQSFGYYPVPFYIPTYATAVGLSTSTGTIALAVFNLSTVVGTFHGGVRCTPCLVMTDPLFSRSCLGQIVAGSLCNRMGYGLLMVVSSMGSALTAFIIWGFAHSAWALYLFAIVFGSIVS